MKDIFAIILTVNKNLYIWTILLKVNLAGP